MKTYKITFQNGDSMVTRMNDSFVSEKLAEAKEYYLNNWFNFGDTEANPKDFMVKGIFVEELL